MKPQVTIEQNESGFVVRMEGGDQSEAVDQPFSSYQQALDFILEQGWQLKRETPSTSLHVETRFLKP